MLDITNLNNSAIHNYIHQVERNKVVIGKDIRDIEIIEKLMSLSQVYIFFKDYKERKKSL